MKKKKLIERIERVERIEVVEMGLPKYINCNISGTIIHCEFYIHKDCPKTCAFAEELKKQCKHLKYCNEPKHNCNPEEINECKIRKKYDQYGEDYNAMGVGGI